MLGTLMVLPAYVAAVLLIHLPTAWVQDGIRVEFEEQLPLREYALRIPL